MEEIGRRLQAARLAKGLTLQDVEDETHIRKKYLEALEAGRMVDIPGEVYAKGFLRAYGNHLGLGGDELVKEFKQLRAADEQGEDSARPSAPAGTSGPVAKAEAAPPDRSSLEKAAAERTAAERTAGERTAEERTAVERPRVERPRVERPLHDVRPQAAGAIRERPARRPSAARGHRGAKPAPYGARRAAVALLLLLPLAIIAYWLLGREASTPPPAPPAVQQQEPPAAQQPGPVETPPEEPAAPVVTTSGPKGNSIAFAVSVSPAVVQVEGFREGFPWVRVTIDGKQAFEGKLSGPATYQGKEVVILFGFTEGIDLVINGQRFPQPIDGGPNTVTVAGR